jgi:hypothetical protein
MIEVPVRVDDRGQGKTERTKSALDCLDMTEVPARIDEDRAFGTSQNDTIPVGRASGLETTSDEPRRTAQRHRIGQPRRLQKDRFGRAGGERQRGERYAAAHQTCRSASSFLISAIARAGLSPLGQALAQFMIV